VSIQIPTPSPEDKFSFGLWTVGYPGRDPFGEPTRPPTDPVYALERLADLGAYGVNFHDDDLIPFGSDDVIRTEIIERFTKGLAATGLVVTTATTNLFTHPVFKDGGFTANDPKVRAFAVQKCMRAMDLGVELGAKIFVMWGGREGSEADACRDAREAIKRYRDCVDFLCNYARDQKYDMRFALEAKPNEPRSDIYLPTTGHMLAFIETLDHPEMVGVNPEVAHEQMSGLNFYHGIAQAIDAGKLFHIDLNDQKPGRYDQDLRFGSESLKGMFFLVKLLEESGYDGPRHFDCHAYRSEDEEGVWQFARGCMRTYLLLKEKARRFAEDAEIQGILEQIGASRTRDEYGLAQYSREGAARLKQESFAPGALGVRGLGYERLDQLVIDLLLGVR